MILYFERALLKKQGDTKNRRRKLSQRRIMGDKTPAAGDVDTHTTWGGRRYYPQKRK